VAAKNSRDFARIALVVPPIARSFWFAAGLRGIAHIVV
jgi:hypothetical protein